MVMTIYWQKIFTFQNKASILFNPYWKLFIFFDESEFSTTKQMDTGVSNKRYPQTNILKYLVNRTHIEDYDSKVWAILFWYYLIPLICVLSKNVTKSIISFFWYLSIHSHAMLLFMLSAFCEFIRILIKWHAILPQSSKNNWATTPKTSKNFPGLTIRQILTQTTAALIITRHVWCMDRQPCTMKQLSHV